jgi:hypothetical protein
VHTESVVVMVGSGLTKAGEPDGVHLVYLELLVRWFKARPAVLSDETVALVVDQARRSTTWQGVSSCPARRDGEPGGDARPDCR